MQHRLAIDRYVCYEFDVMRLQLICMSGIPGFPLEVLGAVMVGAVQPFFQVYNGASTGHRLACML